MNKKLRYTLGKNERLKSRKTIGQIFAGGQGFSLFPFRVMWMVREEEGMKNGEQGMKNGEQGMMNREQETGENEQASNIQHSSLQAAFSVSRRQFKKAVQRNRVKRLMREAWRLQKIPLQETLEEKGLELRVFLIFTGRELPQWELVQEKILQVMKRLQKNVHEKPPHHS